MPTFFYDATYIMFFRWLGFGMSQLYATGMVASVASALALAAAVSLSIRRALVERASMALAWLSAVLALVAVSAAYQLTSFPLSKSLGSYPGIRAALAASTLLLVTAGVSAVLSTAATRRPDWTGRILKAAKPVGLVGILLAAACALLLGWSWFELSSMARQLPT